MGTGKQYDEEFKKQAIKLAKEVGTKDSFPASSATKFALR